MFNGSPYYFIFFIITALFYIFCNSSSLRRIILTISNLLFLYLSFYDKLIIPVYLFSVLVLLYFSVKTVQNKFLELFKKILTPLLFVALGLTYLLSRAPNFSEKMSNLLKWPALDFQRNSIFALAALFTLMFFALRVLHVFFERKTEWVKNLSFLNLFNYVFFFPIFSIGPLADGSQTISQLENFKKPDTKTVYESIEKIINGAFKQFILGSIITHLSLSQLHYDKMSALQFLIAAFFNTLKIYFSFSGYSDIAIGISRLFGVQVPENFNSPFKSRNLADFWNRWHVTFYVWIRNYIFYPCVKFFHVTFKLNIKAASFAALWISFVLAGLWHGFELRFLYYGLFHAFGISVYLVYSHVLKTYIFKTDEAYQKFQSLPAVKVSSVVLTIIYISLGWFFYEDKNLNLDI